MHESEDMVREAGGVGVMLLDPQVRFMMQQPIEDVGESRTPTFTTLELKGAYWSEIWV